MGNTQRVLLHRQTDLCPGLGAKLQQSLGTGFVVEEGLFRMSVINYVLDKNTSDASVCLIVDSIYGPRHHNPNALKELVQKQLGKFKHVGVVLLREGQSEDKISDITHDSEEMFSTSVNCAPYVVKLLFFKNDIINCEHNNTKLTLLVQTIKSL